jgi:CheY-like chemotaxis protein
MMSPTNSATEATQLSVSDTLQRVVAVSHSLLEVAEGQDGPKDIADALRIMCRGGQRALELARQAASGQGSGLLTDALPKDQGRLRHDLRNGLNQVAGYSQLLMLNEGTEGFGAFLPDLQKIYHLCQDIDHRLAHCWAPAQAAPAPLAGSAKRLAVAQESRAKPGKLLIVDDDPRGRDTLRRFLEPMGHLIREAESGAQALEMMAQTAFDLVLLDIVMPGVDGFQVLEQLKAQPKGPRSAIIVISGIEDAQTGAMRCIELGAEEYLIKPIDYRLLQARVNFCLQKRQQSPSRKDQATPPEPATTAEPATIMIVDDEEINRMLLERRVKDLGHRPVLLANGREALERIYQSPPDLILLDLMMPEMGGLEVLQHLKADPQMALIPVIVVSAQDDRDQILPCIRLGAEDYLVKPFNTDLLQARIQGSLQRLEQVRREQRRRVPAPSAAVEMAEPAPARRDITFAPEAVLTRYPAPVAIPYRRFFRQPDPPTRLMMLFSVLEAWLRYLVTLGTSDWLHTVTLHGGNAGPLQDHGAFEFLRRPRPMALGMWVETLRKLAALLADCPERLVQELPDLCKAGGALDSGPLRWLVEKRNDWIHGEGMITLGPDECHSLIGEARARLEEVLQHSAFLCNYPLGFAQPGQAKQIAPGKHRYYLHPCMGAGVANTAAAYVVEVPTPIRAHTPFVIAPDGSRLLYLWPLLAQRAAPISGRHTLYVFERIPDKRRNLTEIRSAAIDIQGDIWQQVLHPLPATDHGWLIESLRKLPASLPLPAELKLTTKLLNLSGGKLVGHQLGSNVLKRAVARGGFSTIYEARHVTSGQRLAVKVIEIVDARGHFHRFREEVEKLQALDHPGIVRCFEFGNDLIDGKEYPWYSMEFAVGGDLSDRLDERRAGADVVPWKETAWRRQILAEFETVVDAVAYLHDREIVHRDIKPSNVLIMQNGELRLSDFGLVKSLNPLAESPTSTGAVLGTLGYMAPEQEKGESILPAADIYALGIVLAELASGRKLYADTRIRDGSTLHRAWIVGQLPGALRRIIQRCTNVDPERRFPDGRALLEELQACRQEMLAC